MAQAPGSGRSPPLYKAPKPPLRLKSAPRFGEVYWCDFSISNVLPEFDAEHPAVIIRSGGKLVHPHLVVPLTSRDHTGDVYAHALLHNPVPSKSPRASWAVCNHIYTVASERLRPITDPANFNNPIYPKLSTDDLTAISLLVRKALLRILTVSLPPAPSTSTARPAPTR